MSSELDLRGLHQLTDPDPAFVERLRVRLESAPVEWVDTAEPFDLVETGIDRPVVLDRPTRRRMAFLAAAAVVVLAAAGSVVWILPDDSDGTTVAADVDPAFIGSWVATDLDSSQTMEIVEAGDTGVEVVAHDDSAGLCSGAPSTMTGIGWGQPDGSVVIAEPELVCDDGTTPVVEDGTSIDELLANLTFVHFPDTDVLDDSLGARWRRAGSDDSAGPASSGGMWPQSSVAEVRRAQARADAGDPDYTWQVDPQLTSDNYDVWHSHLRAPGTEIVERFLRDELGWDHALFNIWADTDADDGVITDAVYLRCAPDETNPMYPDAITGHEYVPGSDRCAPTIDDLQYETVSLDLSQLDRRGPGGIWVVDRWAIRASFAQTDPTLAEAEATARVEDFLQASVEGEGAEEQVEVADMSVAEVPLLYATTAGASYEGFEIELTEGPWWPYGEMAFRVRLFADGGDTVVEQRIEWANTGNPEVALLLDPYETTENGEPADVTHEFVWEGELTLSAAPSWSSSKFPSTELTLDAAGTERIELVDDPLLVTTDCETGPAPAGAAALAASIQARPDLEATAPEAVTIGGLDAVAMDVSVVPGATGCSPQEALLLEREDPTMYGMNLAFGSRMRLYLVDLYPERAPSDGVEGAPTRLMAIAIVAPEARFDAVMAAATPVLESIEFHID